MHNKTKNEKLRNFQVCGSLLLSSHHLLPRLASLSLLSVYSSASSGIPDQTLESVDQILEHFSRAIRRRFVSCEIVLSFDGDSLDSVACAIFEHFVVTSREGRVE